jgi:Glycerophosphoryl diester phosphodiesterase family
VLGRYADILTRFRGDTVDQRALTVIVSGNRARATMAAEAVRYAAVDGTLADLDSGAPLALVPWISDDWQKFFTWSGSGAMPTNDERLLRSIVNRAHAQGRKVRFWNTPDSPLSWTVLLGAGVDLINTNDLVGLERLLRGTH